MEKRIFKDKQCAKAAVKRSGLNAMKYCIGFCGNGYGVTFFTKNNDDARDVRLRGFFAIVQEQNYEAS